MNLEDLQKMHCTYNAHNTSNQYYCKECLMPLDIIPIEEYLGFVRKKLDEVVKVICQKNKISKEKILEELSEVKLVPRSKQRLFYYKGRIFHIKLSIKTKHKINFGDSYQATVKIYIDQKAVKEFFGKMCPIKLEKIFKEECDKIIKREER